MKKLAFLFLLLFTKASACDVCGCFMGIVPYDNQSSISFVHRYRVFNGYRNYQKTSYFFPQGAYKTTHGGHDTSVVNKNYTSKDYESFKVFELRAKYFLHKRIELNAFAAILNNKSKEDTVIINHTGIGDPTFFIGYHVLQPKPDKNFRQRLIIGGGIKLPSGNFYVRDKNNKRLPFLMQPGTGSVDYFGYVTYVVGYKKIGLSTSVNCKINGTNFYKERVGNSITNFASFFYKINTKNWSFIPSVNSYYEYTKGLLVFEKLIPNTSMNELMCGLGLDVFYKNMGINIGAQRTLYQHQEGDNLKSVGRLYASLTYNFNQRKYLLKSKE